MACAADTNTNLVLECDDNITQISMIEPDRHHVVELTDFTMDSVMLVSLTITTEATPSGPSRVRS